MAAELFFGNWIFMVTPVVPVLWFSPVRLGNLGVIFFNMLMFESGGMII